MELFEFLEVLSSEFIEVQGVWEGLLGYQILVLVPDSLSFARGQTLPIERFSFALGDVVRSQHGIYGPLGPSCLSDSPLRDSELLIVDGRLAIYLFQLDSDPQWKMIRDLVIYTAGSPIENLLICENLVKL